METVSVGMLTVPTHVRSIDDTHPSFPTISQPTRAALGIRLPRCFRLAASPATVNGRCFELPNNNRAKTPCGNRKAGREVTQIFSGV